MEMVIYQNVWATEEEFTDLIPPPLQHPRAYKLVQGCECLRGAQILHCFKTPWTTLKINCSRNLITQACRHILIILSDFAPLWWTGVNIYTHISFLSYEVRSSAIILSWSFFVWGLVRSMESSWLGLIGLWQWQTKMFNIKIYFHASYHC